jgi:hypothetical protein
VPSVSAVLWHRFGASLTSTDLIPSSAAPRNQRSGALSLRTMTEYTLMICAGGRYVSVTRHNSITTPNTYVTQPYLYKPRPPK